jgi:hypothetical protein
LLSHCPSRVFSGIARRSPRGRLLVRRLRWRPKRWIQQRRKMLHRGTRHAIPL